MSSRPLLALTQGDPAGIGPEILLGLLASRPAGAAWRPLLIAERAGLERVRSAAPTEIWERLVFHQGLPSAEWLAGLSAEEIPVADPVGEQRVVVPGEPVAADAFGAMAALDLGIEAARDGLAQALVTAPLSKAVVARHHLAGFRGHTDYLAEACGLERYGRDYLMAFLTPDLQVALLTTHVPLTEAVASVAPEPILEALAVMQEHAGGRIAVAGLNPHAGEEGLLGREDGDLVAPAVAEARARGWAVSGPESADSLFARARRGEFDWVLSLYHDQGLIAVKTACFGDSTNWTMGLPFVRTSPDHGTAYGIAGRGEADSEPLASVVETTLGLIEGRLPRRPSGPG